MNKRQAKKKRKKEQQRAEYYATLADAIADAIAELPDIARKIGKTMREAIDRLSEALSEINVEELCKQIKAQKETEDGTN